MNSYQAKQIPIESFLSKLGHHPVKQQGDNLWYHSPLRQDDNTPSFKVNRILNTWYDFALMDTPKTWTIIDLVCVMYQESVSDALRRLSSDFQVRSTYERPMIEKKKKENPLQLISSQPLMNRALYWYLSARGINVNIAKQFIQQVDFINSNTNRKMFAIGIKTQSGGFEFRNKFMKGSLGQKDITVINQKENQERIVIFEGFFDFLSFLTDFQLTTFQSPVIILNSTANWKKALEILQDNKYSECFFFLDRDEAGISTLTSLSEKLSSRVVDKSHIYQGFNDYNEYLMTKLKLPPIK